MGTYNSIAAKFDNLQQLQCHSRFVCLFLALWYHLKFCKGLIKRNKMSGYFISCDGIFVGGKEVQKIRNKL